MTSKLWCSGKWFIIGVICGAAVVVLSLRFVEMDKFSRTRVYSLRQVFDFCIDGVKAEHNGIAIPITLDEHGRSVRAFGDLRLASWDVIPSQQVIGWVQVGDFNGGPVVIVAHRRNLSGYLWYKGDVSTFEMASKMHINMHTRDIWWIVKE